MARLRNPLLWLHSLVSTVIGAAAGAIPVVVVDPEHFNLHAGWRKLALVSAVAALIALANFLKEHPLPEIDADPARGDAGGPTDLNARLKG